jgi:hypothetical protein
LAWNSTTPAFAIRGEAGSSLNSVSETFTVALAGPAGWVVDAAPVPVPLSRFSPHPAAATATSAAAAVAAVVRGRALT